MSFLKCFVLPGMTKQCEIPENVKIPALNPFETVGVGTQYVTDELEESARQSQCTVQNGK